MGVWVWGCMANGYEYPAVLWITLACLQYYLEHFLNPSLQTFN